MSIRSISSVPRKTYREGMTLPSFALKYGYNEMKKLVLTLFTSGGPMDGFDVAQRLRDEHRVEASIRAVQMALMRYWRQGLLHRERREGRYVYMLTEKGGKRLFWLKGIATQSGGWAHPP